MNNALWRGVLIAVLVGGVAAAIALGSYNAGVAHGFVESGRAIAAPPGAVPYAYGWHRPWGGVFPVFPLLFFFLFFAVMRGLWWRGRGPRGWGYHGDGVPPACEEWHRRAHAQPPPAPKP